MNEDCTRGFYLNQIEYADAVESRCTEGRLEGS